MFDEVFENALSIDKNNNIILTGLTNSRDFPVSNTAFIKSFQGGDRDGFISIFTSSGSLSYSSYIGGSSDETGFGVNIDNNGQIIVYGNSNSDDLVTSSDAIDRTYNGNSDVVLLRFNHDWTYNYSTYLGGSSEDVIQDLTISSDGTIYMIGESFSFDFPIVSKNQLGSLSGGFDGFILELQDNEIINSGLIGGASRDVFRDLQILPNNSLVLVGTTSSSDFPVTSDGSQQTFGGGETDGIFIQMNSDYELEYSTYSGGSGEDNIYSVILAKSNAYTIGITDSSISSFPSQSDFPYTFGGQDGIVSNIEEGEIQWSTRTVLVPNPTADYDADELNNIGEYYNGTDPLLNDTDGDSMFDGWELKYNFDPFLDSDAREDPDDDDFSNKQEFFQRSHPRNPDTDGDGIPDGWEFDNQNNPLDKSDRTSDWDGDGMPAIWEYLMDLDPINPNDSILDPDNDELTNFEEFNYTNSLGIPLENGLDANNADTDGDSMFDGWEVKYGLDPLNYTDAEIDTDRDLIKNKHEHKINTDPTNPIQLYLGLSILLLLISITSLTIWKINALRNEIIEEGYDGIWDKRRSRSRGFKTAQERDNAYEKGFYSQNISDIVNAAGYSSASEVFAELENVTEVSHDLSDKHLEKVAQQINATASPIELSDFEEEFENTIQDLHDYKSRVSKMISLVKLVLMEYERESEILIHNISSDQLRSYQDDLEIIEERIDTFISTYNEMVEKRKDWFGPWESLLLLIKMTEQDVEVPLEHISQVINKSLPHAEELLILLLQSHQFIGNYNKETQVYVKGLDDNMLNDFIQVTMEKLKEIEEQEKS